MPAPGAASRGLRVAAVVTACVGAPFALALVAAVGTTAYAFASGLADLARAAIIVVFLAASVAAPVLGFALLLWVGSLMAPGFGQRGSGPY